MSISKLSCVSALAGVCIALPAAAADFTVTIEGVRSGSGFVLAQLCQDAAHFPYSGCRYQAAVPAKTGAVDLVFRNIQPGDYAIAAFHDEDGSFTPDTPGEGTALGNDAETPERMSDAVVAVEPGGTRKINLVYR